jgi:hypothetical protein
MVFPHTALLPKPVSNIPIPVAQNSTFLF